eukprot:11126542-Ditylum_brightwellii.AAC.1
MNKIHSNLGGYFSDATKLDMHKVPCGHFYHTHCLKEVVEHAMSIHAAQCPLCHAPLVPDNANMDSNNTIPVPPPNQDNAPLENNQPPLPQLLNGNAVVWRPLTTANNDAVTAAALKNVMLNNNNPATPPPQTNVPELQPQQ